MSAASKSSDSLTGPSSLESSTSLACRTLWSSAASTDDGSESDFESSESELTDDASQSTSKDNSEFDSELFNSLHAVRHLTGYYVILPLRHKPL